MLIELWFRHFLATRWHDLEAFCQRVLQVDHPELYVERRGGTGDGGRDLVIKSSRNQVVPHGVCQVSAERAWQHKFRRELRKFIKGAKSDPGGERPALWIFLTTQPVHEKKRPSRTEKPRDKEDELAWARGFLEKESMSGIDIEIWGFQDLVEATAHPEKGRLLRDEFGLSAFFGEDLNDWLIAIRDFSRPRLNRSRKFIEMPILGHIVRRERELLRRSLTDYGAVLLTGQGGTGKTGLLVAEALELMGDGRPVVYLQADNLSPIKHPDELGGHMGIQRPLVGVLRRVAEVTGQCYLFFDQMSFAFGTDTSKCLCDLAQTSSGIEGLCVVVACRSLQAGMTGEIEGLGFHEVPVRALDQESVRQLLRKLGIIDPSEALLAVGATMLELSLIADLVEHDEDITDVATAEILWRRYLQSIRKREGDLALDTAVRYARQSLQKGRRGLHIPVPDHPTSRLISRGVLVETDTHMYRFRHEALQDYLYAWDATRTEKTPTDILGEVGELHFPAIGGWVIKIYQAERPALALGFARRVFYG